MKAHTSFDVLNKARENPAARTMAVIIRVLSI
jgi:hypothetical protein